MQNQQINQKSIKAARIVSKMIDLFIQLRAEYPDTYQQINQSMQMMGQKDLTHCWNLLLLAFTLIEGGKRE
ncbi:hypothetical protein NIES4101_74110 [Calothrix sp. NIES-4101]|nr:hypothetical protein NIES4101_74110 [Calothrix sp. NIES-4101]